MQVVHSSSIMIIALAHFICSAQDRGLPQSPRCKKACCPPGLELKNSRNQALADPKALEIQNPSGHRVHTPRGPSCRSGSAATQALSSSRGCCVAHMSCRHTHWPLITHAHTRTLRHTHACTRTCACAHARACAITNARRCISRNIP